MKDKEIFAKLLFITSIVVMLVLAIFRFCGIGYFANTYAEHEYVWWVQELILFSLKWVEGFFILLILTKHKWYIPLIISFLYAVILIFINNNTLVFILDIVYMTVVPFFLSKLDYKYITYGLLLVILLSFYQLLMMTARYSINLEEKFNYIAMIESVFDYKIFIISIYLLVKIRRLKMDRINTPDPEEVKNYGGGGCFLFWGKFDKVCEVIGKILVGICTLGIAPLCVHLYRKSKNEKVK